MEFLWTGLVKVFAMPCIFFALAACAAGGAQPLSKTEKVERSSVGIRYGLGGSYSHMLAARAYDAGGAVGICAAISEAPGGQFMGELTETLKRKATFFIDGDRILRGAHFAPVYPAETVLGKTAQCVGTGAPWKPGYDKARLRISVKSGFVGS